MMPRLPPLTSFGREECKGILTTFVESLLECASHIAESSPITEAAVDAAVKHLEANHPFLGSPPVTSVNPSALMLNCDSFWKTCKNDNCIAICNGIAILQATSLRV